MNRLRNHKMKWLVPISGAVAVTMAIGLLFAGKTYLFGQSEERPIPDIRGYWQAEVTGYVFKNSVDPNATPEYVEGLATEEEAIRIEVQTGRVIAGSGHDGSKLTGIVMPDGTVHMQAIGEGELRTFLTLTLAVRGDRYEMTGYGHMLDDLKSEEDEPDMATFYVRAVKLD